MIISAVSLVGDMRFIARMSRNLLPPGRLERRFTTISNCQLYLLLIECLVQMLQTLLAGGQSSRIYKSIVDNQQLAVSAGAFPYSLEDAGLFIVYGIANMGVSLEDIEAALDEEVKRVVEDGLTAREFQKLANQTENDFISQNTTMSGVSTSLANYYTFFKDPELINTEINKYLAVTPEDIIAVAKKYLVPDNRVVLHYLPKEQQQ